MALAITSFTPTTGPTTGGTSVVITGTGLTAVTSVMFGDVEGAIDTTATNTATSLTVISPSIDNANAGDVKITVLDSVTPTEAQSSTSFTYTAVSLPVLSTTNAAKWKFDVSSDGGTTWVPVRGMTNFTPSVASTTVDDSDYDSVDTNGVAWGSDTPTQLKWQNDLTIDRKTAAGYVEDPGQKVLRLAYAQVGSDAEVLCRWYDRFGGDEAYSGTGIVTWTEKGGATSAKAEVDVKVMGRGVRNTISNPAA